MLLYHGSLSLRYVSSRVIEFKKCQKYKKVFFHFYFLNFYFSFTFHNHCTIIHNGLVEGSVSQKIDSAFSYLL